VLSGPSTSSSSSISIINGNVSKSVSTTYTYILKAEKEGDYTIGEATVEVEGKVYKSNSLTIKVVKGSQQAGQGQYKNQSSSGRSNRDNFEDRQKGGNTFAYIGVSKNTVYQGEPILVTLKVYTQANLVGFNDMKFPNFDGFWSEEIKTTNEITLQRENYNGAIYKVATLRKYILFPQKTGLLTISPMEVECIIRDIVPSSDPFFGFFFNQYQDVKYKVSSQPVKVNVLPLPDRNKSIDFNGGVGKFSISTQISKKQGKTNEAITYKIVISGNGNLKMIDKLDVEFPGDIEVYEPKIVDNINVSENGLTGSRTFEYLIIPRSAGEFKIKPVRFSYFDLSKRDYVTLSTDEIKLTIEKGAGGGDVSYISSYNKSDIKMLGKDIRFIKTGDLELKNRGQYFFMSGWFFLSYILLLLLFIIFLIIARREIKLRSNKMLLKNKKATKIAMKRLKHANIYMKENNREKFYDEILKSFWGYLSDKLMIPVYELNRDNVGDKLKKLGAEEELIKQFIDIIDVCEFHCFSSSLSSEDNMQEFYEKALAVIIKMENVITKRL